jgi:hypothetical protein
MIKRCKVSGVEFELTEEDLTFYKNSGVGLPSHSPLERQRNRTGFRNFRNLYHRVCSGSGKKIISMYDDSVPFPVYENSYWWSDSWDTASYQQDLNFSQPFFEQYKKLAQSVPRFSIMNLQSESCEYSNLAFESKSCYLVFGCVKNEDCLYGHIVWSCKDCVDTLYAFRCEWCSNSVDIVDCYDVHYSTESSNCRESYFLHDCQGCNNCFGCVNLRNKSYYFYNEPCTKEDYFTNLRKILPLTRQAVNGTSEWLEQLKRSQAIYPEIFGLQNEEVSGNHVYESKLVFESFDTKQGEECKHCYTSLGLFGCYDISFTGGSSRFCVDSLTLFNAERVHHSHIISNSSDIDYSEFCYSSKNLFGCIGLRNCECCILNKQYSKDDYFQLREKLIEHMKATNEWGDFIPLTLSPFAYNESIAAEYQPLSKDEVLSRGLKWKEGLINISSVSDDFLSKSIPPEHAGQNTEEILKTAWRCSATNKAYKIIRQELEFYRRMSLPLPSLSPDERHRRRMSLRGERTTESRQCSKCKKKITSAKHGGDPRNVCCNACYKIIE